MPVNYKDELQSYNDMFGTRRILDNVNFGSLLDRFISTYANAAYSYKRRYTISGSVRKDASNLFGVEANRRGIPLWSSGISWNISDEPFYQFALVPVLKARLTYGFSGNLPINRSALTIITYYPATDNRVNLPFASISNPPNPMLRWEKVGMVNAGIDFELKGRRISGSIEYFSKRVKDMLGVENVDGTKGFSSIINNSANMSGKGVDINLNTLNVVGKFNWQTNFLFSYVKNKLTKYLEQPSIYANYYVGNGDALMPIEGKQPYMVASYKWNGLSDINGNPQGIYQNQTSTDYYNIINSTLLGDVIFHGSPLPLIFGSLRNSFSWKQLTVSANLNYKFDYYFRRNTISYYNFANQGESHSDYGKRWQKVGDAQSTTVPSFLYPLDQNRDGFYRNSEATVEKGDNIRIQDIALSYNLSQSFNKRTVLKQLQIYTYVNNINLIIWKANKSGIDPDYVSGLKTPTNISFGLKATL
jgi:hypothetical protein